METRYRTREGAAGSLVEPDRSDRAKAVKAEKNPAIKKRKKKKPKPPKRKPEGGSRMPRKKVVRSETLVKVKDHPKSKIIKRYASLDDEDTVAERVGYRAPTVTYTGETLTIEFEAYTIDTDGKAEPLPDAKPEPLVIGVEAQPPVPPEDEVLAAQRLILYLQSPRRRPLFAGRSSAVVCKLLPLGFPVAPHWW